MMGLPNLLILPSQIVKIFRQDWHRWAATVASGILLVLAFPKFAFSFTAWVALAPLLWAVTPHPKKTDVSYGQAFILGTLAGLIYAFFSMNWTSNSMMRYGGFAVWMAYGVVLLFSSMLALFPGLFALAISYTTRTFGFRAVALAPVFWVASEWLRELITGITWNQLGVSQARHFAIASLSQTGGVALVSFVIASVSTALVLIANAGAKAVKRATIIVAVFGAFFFLISQFDLSSGGPPSGYFERLSRPAVRVAGIQPNIPLDLATTPEEAINQTEKNLGNNIALTKQALSKPADIVIWAESPLVLNYDQDQNVRDKLDALARENKTFLIFNATGREGDKYFNSAQTLSPNPSAGALLPRRYDKIRLVPFGEYVPFRSLLGRFVPTIVGDFTPGREAVVNVLKVEGQPPTFEPLTGPIKDLNETDLERNTIFARVGTFICYEAAYSNVVRQFVNNGATLLVNISDDAWFGASAGPEQHLDHAIMRAIENNRDLVRVTNSGISALITSRGEVVEALPSFTPASHVWEARVRSDKTFYTRHGDWFAKLCAIVSALALIAAIVQRFKQM